MKFYVSRITDQGRPSMGTLDSFVTQNYQSPQTLVRYFFNNKPAGAYLISQSDAMGNESLVGIHYHEVDHREWFDRAMSAIEVFRKYA